MISERTAAEEVPARMRWLRAGLMVAVAALTAAAIWWAVQQPMVVPDTASPPAGNHLGNIDVGNQIGQSFVAELNRLSAVSLVLAAEETSSTPVLTLILREGGPTGPLVRSASMPLTSLPEGNPYNYRPGSLGELWTTFEFDPIPDSAGRPFYYAIEGSTVPEKNRVKTLMMFFNKYPQGKAYVNGDPQNANLVFRTQSEGQVMDYLRVLSRNLTANRPGPLSNPVTYVGLGLAYLVLLGGLIRSIGKAQLSK